MTGPCWPAIDRHAPREFVRALRALMPDAVALRWTGSPAYFPCDDPSALHPEQRLFHAQAGSRPDLPNELAVAVPERAVAVVGTWHGAALRGGPPSGGRRVWLVDGARPLSKGRRSPR